MQQLTQVEQVGHSIQLELLFNILRGLKQNEQLPGWGILGQFYIRFQNGATPNVCVELI